MVPHIHAMALLLRRLANRECPTPQRWAWLIICCRKQLEDVGGVRNLADCVRDLSAGGVEAILPPMFFDRPGSVTVTTMAERTPQNLMQLFLYCLAVVCNQTHGKYTMQEHVLGSGVWHRSFTSSGDLFHEVSYVRRMDMETLLDIPEATWAFTVLTSDACSSGTSRSAIVDSLRAAKPRLPSALIALEDAKAVELTAQAMCAAAKKDLDEADVLTHARSSALQQALSYLRSEYATVSAAIQNDNATVQVLMGVSTTSQSTSAAALSAALMRRDLNAAKDVQRVLQQKHAILATAVVDAVVAVSTADVVIASARIGDRFASGIRSQMRVLRGLVKPSMVDLVAGLQVAEFVILSYLCSLPGCRHSALPMRIEPALFWLAARPLKMWEKVDAWQAAQRREKLMVINDAGDEAVDPQRYVSWLCGSKTDEELFLNVSREDRFFILEAGSPVASGNSFVVAAQHETLVGRSFVDLRMRPEFALPLKLVSDRWVRINGSVSARGVEEVSGIVEAHMTAMVRFRPGVLTGEEMAQLMAPVVQLMRGSVHRGAKKQRRGE